MPSFPFIPTSIFYHRAAPCLPSHPAPVLPPPRPQTRAQAHGAPLKKEGAYDTNAYFQEKDEGFGDVGVNRERGGREGESDGAGARHARARLAGVRKPPPSSPFPDPQRSPTPAPWTTSQTPTSRLEQTLLLGTSSRVPRSLPCCAARSPSIKKERKTYARLQACVKGALINEDHRTRPPSPWPGLPPLLRLNVTALRRLTCTPGFFLDVTALRSLPPAPCLALLTSSTTRRCGVEECWEGGTPR
jgi:hypothetical protein